MKILQLNTVVNSGSTGRIAEDIGRVAIAQGHESYIAFGRGDRPSESQKIRVGSRLDMYCHGGVSLLLGGHGLASNEATRTLIRQIKAIQPDAVGLHNLHGYYINYQILLNALKYMELPVFWTFHDCWPFTGHCSFFEKAQCEKWKTQCYQCPQLGHYPKSFIDRSQSNFEKKRASFTNLENLTVITPSLWLKNLVKQSFFREYPIKVIHNGVDIGVFKPIREISKQRLILGVASKWDTRKGLKDFCRLRDLLSPEYRILLVGLSKKQIASLPKGVEGIERTESLEALVGWYNKALVFLNPTYVDNFPTTNIEALACGTPVITYNTGGSPEAIDENTGCVVDKGAINEVCSAIKHLESKELNQLREACRRRAVKYFDKEKQFAKYLRLYSNLQ